LCFPVGSTATVDVALGSLGVGAVETVPEVGTGVETNGAGAVEAGTGGVGTSAGAGAAAEGCGESGGEGGSDVA